MRRDAADTRLWEAAERWARAVDPATAEDAALARPGAPSSGVKVSGKGKRTLEESESEGEGGEDEQDPGATQDAPSSSKRQRRAIIDEDDEDDD